ncbi:hypothetical protein PSE_1943 [Pseudovibrio sp. FO-BEG1]|nr:hypothetical protein PSE_1943 [Pseudovibrio sp. FO-BEG1]
MATSAVINSLRMDFSVFGDWKVIDEVWLVLFVLLEI